jgi:hypothetical protein
MAKVSAFPKAFARRWPIVEMDVNADDSGFICERSSFVQQPARSVGSGLEFSLHFTEILILSAHNSSPNSRQWSFAHEEACFGIHLAVSRVAGTGGI